MRGIGRKEEKIIEYRNILTSFREVRKPTIAKEGHGHGPS